MILRVKSETVIRHPETHLEYEKDSEGSGFTLLKGKDDPQGQL